jgi:hypothetical protein
LRGAERRSNPGVGLGCFVALALLGVLAITMCEMLLAMTMCEMRGMQEGWFVSSQ